MRYLLDTNIVLIYLKNQLQKEFIDTHYKPFSKTNKAMISIVTLGELKSFSRRNKWDNRSLDKLNQFIDEVAIIGINFTPIIEAYAEIETYSQGKHETKKLPFSARNMGKNDLWIAATAAVAQAKLLTTDQDFLHLNQHFLDLGLVKITP